MCAPARAAARGPLALRCWSALNVLCAPACSAAQSSCNVVMAGLVNTLLPLFLRKLGDDYQKWAVEPG